MTNTQINKLKDFLLSKSFGTIGRDEVTGKKLDQQYVNDYNFLAEYEVDTIIDFIKNLKQK